MKDDFITYKDFTDFINSIEYYTFDFFNNDLHVFFDYGKNDLGKDLNLRDPLYSISMTKAFVIVAPYGFRLTQAKGMKRFNEVEEMAISLSRTPIHLRGKI